MAGCKRVDRSSRPHLRIHAAEGLRALVRSFCSFDHSRRSASSLPRASVLMAAYLRPVATQTKCNRTRRHYPTQESVCFCSETREQTRPSDCKPVTNHPRPQAPLCGRVPSRFASSAPERALRPIMPPTLRLQLVDEQLMSDSQLSGGVSATLLSRLPAWVFALKVQRCATPPRRLNAVLLASLLVRLSVPPEPRLCSRAENGFSLMLSLSLVGTTRFFRVSTANLPAGACCETRCGDPTNFKPPHPTANQFDGAGLQSSIIGHPTPAQPRCRSFSFPESWVT